MLEILIHLFRGKATSSTLALARAMVILSSFLIGAYMVSHCLITLNFYSCIMIGKLCTGRWVYIIIVSYCLFYFCSCCNYNILFTATYEPSFVLATWRFRVE